MSASNWSQCPVCRRRQDQKSDEARTKAKESYGVVSAEEYADLLARAEKIRESPLKETMRQDYEQYIDEDGDWHVRFRGECMECGTVAGFACWKATMFSPKGNGEVYEKR